MYRKQSSATGQKESSSQSTSLISGKVPYVRSTPYSGSSAYMILLWLSDAIMNIHGTNCPAT